jgi:Flp pilus assembly protein TadG
MTGRERESGQAIALVVVFVTIVLGAAAAVLDVGAWFREDRDLQATVDAAALAGAQALPQDPATATSLAVTYGDKNGGGISAANVSFATTGTTGDTIVVSASRPAGGFFTKIFGIDSATVRATAKARAAVPATARFAAPIAVDEQHPMISGSGCPCFGQSTVLDFYTVGPGAFKLVNIDGSRGGTGPQILGRWIRLGFDGYMPVDWYYSDPGYKPSSSHIKSALTARIGDVLLFPVYRRTREQGAGFEYEVVGWVGFRLDDYDIRGSNTGLLYGEFVSITWEGIQGESGTESEDFGVRVVSLVE